MYDPSSYNESVMGGIELGCVLAGMAGKLPLSGMYLKIMNALKDQSRP